MRQIYDDPEANMTQNLTEISMNQYVGRHLKVSTCNVRIANTESELEVQHFCSYVNPMQEEGKTNSVQACIEENITEDMQLDCSSKMNKYFQSTN